MKTQQTKLALLEQRMEQNSNEHADLKSEIVEVKGSVKEINGKLDKAIEGKADKAEFLYWRNFLISGLFLSVIIAVVSLLISKYLQ